MNTLQKTAGAILSLSLLCGMQVYAFPDYPSLRGQIIEQSDICQGVVKDANGESIIGASVLDKGTTNGSITGLDGDFSLRNVKKGDIIVVSYVGYQSQEIAWTGEPLNIVLKEDAEVLDEVVVIGYGAVRKADMAGSVAVLDNKNFKDQPITQVADALQGRVSGVHVENSGVPGGSVKIRIRGANSISKSNDPLYVVDGIVRESGLDGINPEDIRSMQVLKDASSTAIYGSRGSNGVVLITTKSGKAGVREIMFDASVGVSNVYKRYDILGAYDYALALKEVKGIDFSNEEMQSYQNGTAGIDWQDEIFRTGITQNYKLALSNGSEKTQYYISANYMSQEGVVIESKNERYQAKANLSSQLTDWLHITADINASHGVRRGGSFASGKDNPIWIALNYSPTMTMMAENGNYNTDTYNSIASNPVGILKLQSGETMTNVFNGRVDLRLDIMKGLTFTTTNGVDYYDGKSYSFSSKRVGTKSGMGNNDTYRLMLQSSNNLTYTGSWNDHHLTATAVYEVTSSETRTMGITGNNLLTEGADVQGMYSVYQEGIYLGYRYFETRYEDVVMGTAKAGDYNWATTVAYPFGYGDSYTTFAYSNFNVTESDDAFTVTLKVTNTGKTFSGKETVQIYFQSPYTAYDKANGIEKAAAELCGFAKTDVLAPGASEDVTITVPKSELRTYDANNAKTYIVDAGDYYFTAATDSHNAVNNILAAKGYTVENTNGRMTEDGNTDLVWKWTNDTLDTTTFSTGANGTAITNLFDESDPNKSSNAPGSVTWMSRSDWTGTIPTAPAQLTANETLAASLAFTKYDGSEANSVEMPTLGAKNGLTLASMIGKDFDDPEWDTLLDQLTYSEMVNTITLGFHNTAAAASIGKTATKDENGPQGLTAALTGGASAMCYTSEDVMAATFNVDLINEVGRCIGEDCLAMGYSGLYGPGINMHRTAYCGRNFEYYSEDPFVVQGRLRLPEARRPERLRDQPPRCQHLAERADRS